MAAILTQELSDLTNGAISTDIAGFILGAITMVILFIVIELVMSSSRKGKGGGEAGFLVSAGVGFVIDVGIGWFPLWTVIIIGLILAILLVGPLSSKD